MIYYKKYKYFQKVQAIMNKKKSKKKNRISRVRSRFRGKRKRSRQKELVEIQLRTLAMDYWSVLEYHNIYCLDFKNKNPGSYFNTSVSLADHY